jgi:U6 snRNA-associated Sm-like protein LSm1
VASLAEQLDRKLLVQTRDGRTVVGVLRSFDQFSNMVLEQAYERHIVHEKFADEQLGLFIVRGENLVLMGEIDDAREKPPELKEVSLEEIRDAMLAQRELEGLAGKSEREQKSILDDN